jgi:Lipopolysaccharide biosynthesis protein
LVRSKVNWNIVKAEREQMILNSATNRLGFYFFYDENGIVDRYVTYFLEDFYTNFSELVIVCNKDLSPYEKDKLLKFTSRILVLEGNSNNVQAYKKAMEFYGWNNLADFDEIVLTDNSMMGPIYPFALMFSKMIKEDLDFWGITKRYEIKIDSNSSSEFFQGYIESYFIAFRKSILQNEEFRNYWNHYDIQLNTKILEKNMTHYFTEKGFRWNSYVNMDDLKEINTNLLLSYPQKLIKERACPIFNKLVFCMDYNDSLMNTLGQSAVELYQYICDQTNYDTDMIWENILRTCNQADFVQDMHLQYILSSTLSNKKKVDDLLKNKRVALVMHIYFEDLIDIMFDYASSMPEDADIFITTNSQHKKNKIEEKFVHSKCNKVEVRIIENRGRDVSSILVGVKDVIEQYEFVCFVHDKKSPYIKPESIGESFAYKCLANTLYNKHFVYNIIETFENNPNLGLLSPPEPNHGSYFAAIGNEWGPNFKKVKMIANQFNIHVPMSEDKPPIAPLGTMFWFRTKAFRNLYDADLQYEDFPQEPNGTDGTILHAIERLYPYAVQQMGYYPAILMVDKLAAIEYTNLRHYVRGYNSILFDAGFYHNFVEMQKRMRYDFFWRTNDFPKEIESLNQIICEKSKEMQFWYDIANERLDDILSKQCIIDSLNIKTNDLQQEICRLIPQTSIKRQISVRIKRMLPRWLRKTAVRIKRRFLGPREIQVEDN